MKRDITIAFLFMFYGMVLGMLIEMDTTLWEKISVMSFLVLPAMIGYNLAKN